MKSTIVEILIVSETLGPLNSGFLESQKPEKRLYIQFSKNLYPHINIKTGVCKLFYKKRIFSCMIVIFM